MTIEGVIAVAVVLVLLILGDLWIQRVRRDRLRRKLIAEARGRVGHLGLADLPIVPMPEAGDYAGYWVDVPGVRSITWNVNREEEPDE
jgi:hypothetical protein